ncbi:hypothetical protein QTP70_007866 [Hemibagrus guttatus]|uniref:Uncharacterized protein n=1 Tax=Hemibagrus guttatus TaxID=175788 RepID=A0AAE0QT61_9TELE|nr:hypothetical protein QTP70_007866 [Hemibagrus guttatus]KAK3560359.1 hypothetical protein QTP86_006441 [Hemibagrus guttatus]
MSCECVDNTTVTCLNKNLLDLPLPLQGTKYLSVSDNRIQALPSKGLEELHVLDLTNNDLSEWLTGATRLVNMGNLTHLHLRGNGLSTFKTGLFQELKNLTYLDLTENNVKMIPQKFLQGLSKLQTLSLSLNQIHTLSCGAFEEASELRVLHLNSNNIEVLDTCVFENCVNLNSLFLSNNHLKSVNQGTFRSAIGLVHLDLSSNMLITVPTDALKDTSNLTSLYLQKNAISTPPTNDNVKSPASLTDAKLKELLENISENQGEGVQDSGETGHAVWFRDSVTEEETGVRARGSRAEDVEVLFGSDKIGQD